jgi:prepilin peptidase CpaA
MKYLIMVVLIELLLVSAIDLKKKKISNLWFALNLVMAMVFHFTMKDVYPFGWENLIFPLGWIAGGFLLFLLNIMGAGDSKYLASLFLMVPAQFHLQLFGNIISSTIIVGIILVIMTIIKNFKKLKAYTLSSYWSGIRDTIKSRFSYAPVILLAWMLFGVTQWH